MLESLTKARVGAGHPAYAIPFYLLGGVYLHQGKYAEGEVLLKRALALGEKEMARKEPLLLAAVLNNLAAAYYELGKNAEVEAHQPPPTALGDRFCRAPSQISRFGGEFRKIES